MQKGVCSIPGTTGPAATLTGRPGAHILLLARGKDALQDAKAEVASHRRSSNQAIDAIATDLCDHLAVIPLGGTESDGIG